MGSGQLQRSSRPRPTTPISSCARRSRAARCPRASRSTRKSSRARWASASRRCARRCAGSPPRASSSSPPTATRVWRRSATRRPGTCARCACRSSRWRPGSPQSASRPRSAAGLQALAARLEPLGEHATEQALDAHRALPRGDLAGGAEPAADEHARAAVGPRRPLPPPHAERDPRHRNHPHRRLRAALRAVGPDPRRRPRGGERLDAAPRRSEPAQPRRHRRLTRRRMSP